MEKRRILLLRIPEIFIYNIFIYNKDTVIIFSPSLVLEKCQKENEYDQIVLIAKQLQEMFPKICGVDKYQYDINGGDYTIDGRQKWRIAFVLKKESVEEKNIINYNFHRIEVYLDENYNVYSITIHNENLNNKIGDYPIITVEEAKNRLLEQRYWTSATYPPNQDNISKTYEYHIYNAQMPNPLKTRYCTFVSFPLDIGAMREGAKYLIGAHDFVSFCNVRTDVEDTVRTIYSLDILPVGDEITIRIQGNGFLYNMVRIIVGTLVRVGRGFYTPEQVQEILEAKNRKAAGVTAPPQGLFLVGIEYEE